ncbi:MAG: hypothetical protein K5829_12170 [Treponema sp.]|nr:hypothetical protein [Treponema sp.]
MKKLVSLSAVAVALCGLLLSGCASSDAKSSGPVSVHPRSYTFDVIDGGEVLSLVYNQYGPNYQVTPFFTSLVKKDKPKAGDTITFKMKATTDVDLPVLLCYPCSTSPSWTNLLGESLTMAENVKAGDTFECELTFVLTADVGGDFALCMQYDNPEQEVKTGGPCKLTLERVCESTDTTKEVPSTPHNPNVTVPIEKYSALTEIATNHPWVNGAQDMSVISNYQANPDFTAAFGDDLPIVGDTVHITWHAVSDVDIAQIYCRLVDCSSAAGWWKELNKSDSGYVEDKFIMIKDIKAGEVFDVDFSLPVEVAPTAQVNFCLWYDVGDANPDGPALIKFVRD